MAHFPTSLGLPVPAMQTRSSSFPNAGDPIPTPSLQLSEAASLASLQNSHPDFLLDDDPFANHIGARPLRPHYGSSTSPRTLLTSLSRKTSIKQPRSPLATEPSSPVMSPSSSPPHVQCRSPSSPTQAPSSLPVSGQQLHPAFTRPAFAACPSLPSLHMLTNSCRRGNAGTGLPQSLHK